MSTPILRSLVARALFVHGLGHLLGFSMPARSWLLPGMKDKALRVAGRVIWVAAAFGFVAACLGFWGVVIPGVRWRPLAAGTAVVSLAGLVLFWNTWPAFNTLGALGMNVAVLVAHSGSTGRRLTCLAGKGSCG